VILSNLDIYDPVVSMGQLYYRKRWRYSTDLLSVCQWHPQLIGVQSS